jgi:hypothetical protein
MAKRIYKAPISDEIIDGFQELAQEEGFIEKHYATLRNSRLKGAYINFFAALVIVAVGSVIVSFTAFTSPLILFGPLVAGLIFFLYSIYELGRALRFKNSKRNIGGNLKEVCEAFYLNAIANGKGSRLEGRQGDSRVEMIWEICDLIPYFLFKNTSEEIPAFASKWLEIRNRAIQTAYSTPKSLDKNFPLASYVENKRENPNIVDVAVSVDFWEKSLLVEFHNVAARDANGNWFLLSLDPGELVSGRWSMD